MRRYLGGGLGFAAGKVALEPAERLLEEVSVRCTGRKPLRRLGDGALFLTSHRVVWLKYRFALARARVSKVDLSYADIVGVSLAAGSLTKWPTVTIETQECAYDFVPYGPWGVLPIGVRKAAEKLFGAISEARSRYEAQPGSS